jgi:transcription antitermination factor NusG
MVADCPIVTPDEVLRLPQDLNGCRWWVLQSGDRLADRFKESLEQLGAVAIYLKHIVRKKEKNGQGRTFLRPRLEPMFRGYIFANGDSEQIYTLRENRRFIYSITPVRHQQRHAHQISIVMEAADSGASLRVEPVKPGRLVRITAGAMMGIEGTVIESRPTELRFSMVSGKEVVLDLANNDFELVE